MGDVHDASYYAKCMVGGIFACGITHAAVCPLDIVKCRMQVSYSGLSQNALCGSKSANKVLLRLGIVQMFTLLFCLSDRPTPACTRASLMASSRSRPLRASRASLS
mmetsp:Transcript_4607/g.5696  ORF Transcript_4607/g.5696 Transcript_4607/m.5696 type:complete len:106 (+) Transcript_4607:84-401(+)